ncbi:unnamed protein product [Adineta steineri]|uniref:Uncharacterized protein n=1 Tax=Adineta steineri TaxID=433720 RepID=A0A818RPW5_9BILA|nr:unnamed protein product [Adineta steineri]CAF3656523.1 unnamed protein product [Adineta steineri]
MEEDFFLNSLDSLNLSGQWQPSSMPDILDSSLNSQILDDIVLSTDDYQHASSSPSDDISNALIGPGMDLVFESFSPTNNSEENDDISALISTPIGEISTPTGEVPNQGTIEQTMYRMSINQTNTDMLSSVQIGSSPVEQNKIDNSILASKVVRTQQRLYKNASKSRKSSSYRQASSTVAPIDVLSSYGVCQPCTTAQMEDDLDFAKVLQMDSMESQNKIQIKSHPRGKYRPRTEKESQTAAHYLRCEQNSGDEHPSIYIPFEWCLQSLKNIIQVTLVGVDKDLHCYKIRNNKSSTDLNAPIFHKPEDPHSLYFYITDEDVNKGYKNFMIELIKSKQDEIITKDLIKTRQLEQSMLRFTRFYENEKNTFERDESSTEYSCVMSEAYGDIDVVHMSPRFGPMCGNEIVYAHTKGRFIKEDITVVVSKDGTCWFQPVSFTKKGDFIYFSMPPCPFTQVPQAQANITIYYKGEELYQFAYIYTGSLDQVLAGLNLNDSPAILNEASSSNAFNAYDCVLATGVCPVNFSSKKSSTAKRPKRLNVK